MSICDPLMVMANGELIFSGAAGAARRDPRVVDAYLGDLPS